MRWPLYAAFAISGVAGLMYEVLWSRYLGLWVGHAAYAQVLVLAVYLGGMAVGSYAVSGRSQRLRDPLRAYAAAEAALAAAGVAFPLLFPALTGWSYDVLFPALGNAGGVGAVRWALAGLMVLPQAVVLGATFPLMAAGLVRAEADRPGRAVAVVYLLNALGGAAGVLIAGFVTIGRLGLPGTSWAAALLNLVAAAVVLRWRPAPTGASAAHAAVAEREPDVEVTEGRADIEVAAAGAPGRIASPTLLLVVAFGTALASFGYEIGWIRMLSLVLGSATHAFELMLSAFIFGLGLGSWGVRDATDRTPDPGRLLGYVQLWMGATAAASIVLYLATFEPMAWMVRTLPERPFGYAWFNLARYGLCLLVMLPSTVLAGTTLPLVVTALLRRGEGEAAIGTTYAVNTVGSVAGAVLAGLVGLPYLGLKGLLLAAAVLDSALGVALLARSGLSGRSTGRAAAHVAAAAAVFAAVGFAGTLEPARVASGVYRSGRIPGPDEQLGLYYQDGRTATVSAHVGRADGVIVLAINGKPDASLGPRWLLPRRDTLPPTPIPANGDYATQVLAPLLALAHNPGARNAANIGHGSGMSAASLLTSPTLERLVTIEIEPLMVEGSLVFTPANAAAFEDPRASYVFDDAKSFFAYGRERFDIVFAEPSNPWVSGASSLFTEEFYRRMTGFLADGGVLAQWVQIYELDDDLFLSVLAALDAVFPSYRAYLVGDADVAIVARADGPLPEPDWSVLESAGFRELTLGAPRFTPATMESLRLFDERTFRFTLGPVRPNSDYRPVLDLGAERARFHSTFAEGVYSFVQSRVDLGRVLSGLPSAPHRFTMVPAYGLPSAVLWGRAAWLRDVLGAGGGIAPDEFPAWQEELVHLQAFLQETAEGDGPLAWQLWARSFTRAEASLHWGTQGWTHEGFYGATRRYLERTSPPAPAIATVDLTESFSLERWAAAAAAADQLAYRVAAGEVWMRPGQLLDMAVIAHLRAGSTQGARNALELLEPVTGRSEADLRNRLLRDLVDAAEASARD